MAPASKVAGASAVLWWRLAVLTGIGDRTLTASEQALLGGVKNGLALLVALAVVAAGVTSAPGCRHATGLKAAA